MKAKNFLILNSLLIILTLISCNGSNRVIPENESRKPNIIYILADDLGFGDLGAYGQEKIETPNLDRLAKQGILFENHYTGSTVCAPSRSSWLTGLHTGHTPIRGNKELKPEGQEPMPDSLFTIGKLMKASGYKTAAFGKWGLGFIETTGDPINQGFDYFFGYNCQRIAHRYFPEYLWENQEKYPLKGNDWTNKETYAQDVIHEKTMAFLEENKEDQFFMFVPLVAPHAELVVPDDEIFQKYRRKFGEEKPYVGKKGADYGPDLEVIKYQSQEYPRATYASMVERIDRYVGEILNKIDELGLADDTIIMFASDNGPHREGGNDPDFFNSNGPFRGYKRDLYEGGVRTPFIVKWPGVIKPSTITNHVSAFWDVLPTLADIVGYKKIGKIDGISFLPTLKGDRNQKVHEFLYWEFVEQGGKQAVRKGDWKAVKLNVRSESKTTIELYNLKLDISEKKNLANQFPEIVKEMLEVMDSQHVSNPVYPLYTHEGKEDNNLVIID